MTVVHRPIGAPVPSATPGPVRSLVLAGGGMRVAYQAGALRALVESGLTFSHADGASGGTMNLAMWMSGLTPIEMCDRWRSLNVQDFATIMPIRDYLRPEGVKGLGSAEGVVDRVFPHLGIDAAKINGAEGLVGTFNLCDFTRKTGVVVTSDKVDTDLLVAAISLPMVMPPVEKDGSLYLDAVWIRDANPMEAVRRGADEIWIVWCIGNTPEYRAGAFHEYVHMIEISANGALFGDFDRIREVNEAVARGERPYGRETPVQVYLVKPEYPLPLDPDLFAGEITTGTLIDMGYRDAVRALKERTPITLTPADTRMRIPGVGLAFREVMAGPFAFEESEPAKGARAGRDRRSTLTMHASVEITDLTRFLAEPQHTGLITGHLDVPGLGSAIPSKTGVFNLLAAGPDGSQLMVYELGFELAGEDNYLAGRKELRSHSGLRAWKETTTLYTRLHRGRDARGPAIGAGILTLSVAQFARMLPTIAVRNAHSALEWGDALARFGAFFSADLYDRYVLRQSPGTP
jgi:predicted acylesterase/phospholipase RssA